MEHICKESKTCCYSLALEPAENCPQHGAGEWPPRCGICGKFLPWSIREKQLPSLDPSTGGD